MSRRTSKTRRIVPNILSFLPAESSACVCLHLLSLTKCGITEENQDESPMSHAISSLSKFHTRQIERRRISNLANMYRGLWQGETHRRWWL